MGFLTNDYDIIEEWDFYTFLVGRVCWLVCISGDTIGHVPICSTEFDFIFNCSNFEPERKSWYPEKCFTNPLFLLFFLDSETQEIVLEQWTYFLTGLKSLTNSSGAWGDRNPKRVLFLIKICPRGRHTFLVPGVFSRMRIQLWRYNKKWYEARLWVGKYGNQRDWISFCPMVYTHF